MEDVLVRPALALALEASRRGGNAPAVLVAADEVAIAAFMAGELPFTAIPDILRQALNAVPVKAVDDLDEGATDHTQMIWRGTMNDWRDPSGFPRIKLRPGFDPYPAQKTD